VEQPHPIQHCSDTEPKNAQIMHLSFSIARGRRIQESGARIQKEELIPSWLLNSGSWIHIFVFITSINSFTAAALFASAVCSSAWSLIS